MSESGSTRTRKSPILLSDGGVEALLCALVLEQEFTAGIRIRHLRGEGADAERREHCARQQSSLLEVDIEEVVVVVEVEVEEVEDVEEEVVVLEAHTLSE